MAFTVSLIGYGDGHEKNHRCDSGVGGVCFCGVVRIAL